MLNELRKFFPKGFLIIFTESEDYEKQWLRIRGTLWTLSDIAISPTALGFKTQIDHALSVLAMEDAKLAGVDMCNIERGRMVRQLVEKAPPPSARDCVVIESRLAEPMVRNYKRDRRLEEWARKWGLE